MTRFSNQSSGMQPTPEPSSPDALARQHCGGRQRVITLRSVLLGLGGTILISALAPYNDYALKNTLLIGSYLPLALVSLLFFFAVVINGPLSRFLPRFAFTTSEICVAFVMILVACAVPSTGLMGYWVPSLIAPIYHAQTNVQYFKLLSSLDLPKWLFPDFAGDSIKEWIHDPIVSGFIYRWTGDGPIPYWAWIRPAIIWGIFFFALYGAMICMVAIVHRQWYESERLAFPLATVQLSLVEQPSPGRYFNRIFSQRVFWIGFGAVFLLHMISGLHKYWPKHIPIIPISYDLRSLFVDDPWSFTDTQFKEAMIYFTVIGVMYFISTSVSFSLWFFFILRQVHRIMLGMATGDGTPLGEWDIHSGGLMAYALITLWIGRSHWKLVFKQALRGVREGEEDGRYLSHRWAFWGFILCILIMIGFLAVAGAGVGGAAVIVLLLVTLLFTMTRIVAETGLLQAQLLFQLFRPFQLASMSGWQAVSGKTFYYASMLHMTFYDNRASLPIYAAHAAKVSDQAIFNGATDNTPAQRHIGRKLIALMFLALVVSYATGLSSMLWTEYHHGVTLDATQEQPLNAWPVQYMVPGMMNATMQYEAGNVRSSYDPWSRLGGGFVITIFLSAMRLRYVWWPFHPVGFVMMPTGPVLLMWFSIFLSWLAKTMILRFGGNKLYQDLKPLFIGLIVGEAVAAGVWLVVALILSGMGLPYQQINILPY